MRALRYAIYGYLFSAIVLSAAMQNQTLSSLLCLLVMLPAMVHTAMQGSLTWARFAHVLEALSLPALLYSLRCSQELLYLAALLTFRRLCTGSRISFVSACNKFVV
jgi:hypothetical protein